MNGNKIRSVLVGMVSCYALQGFVVFAAGDLQEAPLEGEPMVVEGERLDSFTTDYASPSIEVSTEQIERYNAVTIEDALRYQPSLIVRWRYIGDPNGALIPLCKKTDLLSFHLIRL